MPRISTAYVSNADQSKETTVLNAQGKVDGNTGLFWPRFSKVSK